MITSPTLYRKPLHPLYTPLENWVILPTNEVSRSVVEATVVIGVFDHDVIITVIIRHVYIRSGGGRTVVDVVRRFRVDRQTELTTSTDDLLSQLRDLREFSVVVVD